jgi:hypothetical protein
MLITNNDTKNTEIMSSLQMFQNSGIFCDVKSDIVRRQRQILR